jgi:hypothetical protein
VLLYADDLVLLAESVADLQRLLDVLQSFCARFQLTVNTSKSESVIFNQHFYHGRATRVRYQGVLLPLSTTFTYLGLPFDSQSGVQRAMQHMLGKGQGALGAMLHRCRQRKINNVFVRCRLFDALVRPVLNYGCEIWGPACIALGASHADRKEVEGMHLGFLRASLGIHKHSSTPAAAIMTELDRVPLVLAWLQQCIRFWNKLSRRPANDLARQALVESIALAREGVTAWSWHFQQGMRRYGVELLGHGGGDGSVIKQLDEKHIMELALAEWRGSAAEGAGTALSVVRAQPDSSRQGFRMLVYASWFSVSNTPRERFWFHLSLRSHITAVAHFRLGSHQLRILHHDVARSQRLCTCCDSAVCEDELHMLFECPAYDALRLRHHTLFEQFQAAERSTPGSLDLAMRVSVNPVDGASEHDSRLFWRNFVSFLLDCQTERSRILAAHEIT